MRRSWMFGLAGFVLGLCACGVEVTLSAGGTGGQGCTPGETRSCACLGATDGVQTCDAGGKSFSVCQCGAAATSTSGSGAGGQMGACGDGIVEPSDHCDQPGNKLYCQQDCQVGTGGAGTSGAGGACESAGHLYYAGKFDGAPSAWANLPAAGGLTGLDAGDAQCKALGVGADHVCDYTEVVAAYEAGEAGVVLIPQGTSAWVQRTTTVDLVGTTPVSMNGTPSAPGPGGNCNNWTYPGNHLSDGEYVTFDTAGTPTFHLDNDTIFDPSMPGLHTIPGDLQCGGTTRSILCCYQACM